MHAFIEIDASHIPDLDDEQLTQEEKAERLDQATAAMFAAHFNAPAVVGGKAKAIVEARQAKATAAAMAALFATMGN